MNHEDIYTGWRHECQEANVQADFSSRTMQLIHGSLERRRKGSRRSTYLTALGLAAGALLVMMGHATTIGILLCSMTGVAQ